ncbi:MAG: YncE family protein [Candidatus Sulfotelmatobacter sp.]
MKRILLSLAILGLGLMPRSFSQKLLTTIPVGGQPGQLAANPLTNMIYVPNETLGTLSVIDGRSTKVIANIPAGTDPGAVAVNPLTNLVYVSNSGGPNLQNPSIIVIDGSSNLVVDTIPATIPGPIAVNPVTNMVYFANGSGASVSVLDATNNEIVDTFGTSHCCLIQKIAMNSVTNRIYVAENGFAEQVVVIDGSTNKFDTIQVAGDCDLRDIAVDSVLNRIYVTDDICGNLYVISGVTNKVIATIFGYLGPLALSPQNNVIVDFDFDVLGFLSATTDSPIGGTVTLPNALMPLNVVAGSNNRYYAAFYKSNGIAVVAGPEVPSPKSQQ